MTAYLLMGLLLAMFATTIQGRQQPPALWFLMMVVLSIFVGLRHRVGMDWNNYLIMIQRAYSGDVWESLSVAEPAYAIMLWFSADLNFGIYGANLIGAVFLMLGVSRLAKSTPNPWMALMVALPFLLVVIGMSANRQAIAIGILLWLVAGWQRSSLIQRVAVILMAGLFHASAVFFLAFVALDLRVNFALKYLIAFALAIVSLYILQQSGSFETYQASYIESENAFASTGAMQHVMLNAGPALLLLTPRWVREQLFPFPLIRQMALVALMIIPLALILPTAAGRLTLYFFPVSIFGLSALPLLFRSSEERTFVSLLLSLFMVFVLWFWLSFANSSGAHLPYRNALFIPEWELVLCCR